MVKVYKYYYNKQFAAITDSATLKATAADCIGDAIATAAVLASTAIPYATHFATDGYCAGGQFPAHRKQFLLWHRLHQRYYSA